MVTLVPVNRSRGGQPPGLTRVALRHLELLREAYAPRSTNFLAGERVAIHACHTSSFVRRGRYERNALANRGGEMLTLNL